MKKGILPRAEAARKPVAILTMLLLAGLGIALSSCESETPAEQTQTPPQNKAFTQIPFEQLPLHIQSQAVTLETQFKKQTLHSKKERSFGNIRKGTSNRLQREDGRASYTLALSNTEQGLYYDNLVINEAADGSLTTHIIRYQPELSWYGKHITEGLSYEEFSGGITVFNDMGVPLSSVTLASGNPVKTAAKGYSAKLDQEALSCEIVDIDYVGGCVYECWWSEIIITLECTVTGSGGDDWMSDPDYGGGGTGGGYGGVDYGGGGTGAGAPIGTVPIAGLAEQIVVEQKFAEDYPCQAQIVEEVYSNCAPLSQLFQAIFESNDNINVTFRAEQLQGILDGGDTDGETPHNYTIKINTLRLNQSTELDLINTVVHEYVHALMFHYFYSGAFQLTDAGNPPSYAQLAEGFAQHRAGFGGDQHPYIASLVNDIAEVTYDWAVNNGYMPDNFSTFDTNLADGIDGLKEFLQKLAWGGLEDTSTFESLYPDNTLIKQQLQKLIQDEIFPNAADATPQGESPTPCN